MARPVFIVDGSRTPFLKARSGPGPFTPVDLAVQCGRPLLARQPFAPNAFDQVILGCVNVIADEMNPARVAALRLGMGEKMVAFTVQINCGSGMQSIDTGLSLHPRGRLRSDPRRRRRGAEPRAAGLAATGRALVRTALPVPRVSAQRSWRRCKARPSYFKPIIGLERGLTDPITELNMGQTAEVVGHLFGITRAQSDAYAAESHKRLANAQSQGWLKGEVETAFARDGKFYDHDDGVRPDSIAGDAGQTEAGVRASLGPGHRRQFLADHRRRVLGDPRFRRGGGETRPDAEGRHSRQPVVGARSRHHGPRPGAVGDRTVEAQ